MTHEPDPAAGEVLDPNDVAALLGEALSPDEREVLVKRLAAGPVEGQREAAWLARAAGARENAGAHASPWRWLPLAAAVLLAVGLVVHAGRGSGSASAVTSWSGLAAARPDLFHRLPDRAPLAPVETRRGGLRVLEPCGTLLVAPQRIAWEAQPGAGPYDVLVVSGTGEILLERRARGNELEWPPATQAAPGSEAVVAVSTIAGGLRREGSCAFQVLTKESVVLRQQAHDAIDAVASPTARALLHAEVDARWGLWREVEAWLRDEPPTSPVQALRDAARDQLGAK